MYTQVRHIWDYLTESYWKAVYLPGFQRVARQLKTCLSQQNRSREQYMPFGFIVPVQRDTWGKSDLKLFESNSWPRFRGRLDD